MTNHKMFRFTSLLLALGLLLGLAVSGCSDNNNNSGSSSNSKTFYFNYTLADLGKTEVSKDATHMQAMAFDAAGKEGSAVLGNNIIENQYDTEDKSYYAKTTVSTSAIEVVYVFYYEDEASGALISTGTYLVNVGSVADGQVVENSTLLDDSVQTVFYDETGEALPEGHKFAPGSEFTVDLTYKGASIGDYVGIISEQEDVTAVESVVGTHSFEIASTATTGEKWFVVKYLGIVVGEFKIDVAN